MSSTPNRRPHEDGGSGNHGHQSGGLKFPHPHDDQAYPAKVGPTSSRHEYVPAPFDNMGQDSRMPKLTPPRDAERRSPLLPNMLFRVPSSSSSPHPDHVAGSESQQEQKLDKPDVKPESSGKVEKELKFEEGKDSKHERDGFSEQKGEVKHDMDGSASHVNWREMHRGNVDPWRVGGHASGEAVRQGSGVETRDLMMGEAVEENKVDLKGEDKLKDKDRKKKERDSEKWGNEKKDASKDKEKVNERENLAKKETGQTHNEVGTGDVLGKSAEQEHVTAEQKKDHDTKEKKKEKEKEANMEVERPEKRIRPNDKESEEGGMDGEGDGEREREAFGSGVQQRKRMLRPRGSPQIGNRFKSRGQDAEGSQGKSDVSCVVYKIGECMQELIKLWKEYESSQADKTRESSQNGPTLEIRIPAEHVTATNRQVRAGQLWGTDIYTVDSDLVAVLMHTGYCRPTASPPPAAAQELRAKIRVLPPQECYVSSLRNNVRSRAWGAAIGCSYRVEKCCIVKKGGGVVDLEPCLTHSSSLEPTLAPVAVERTMTTRAAASNASRQQRFVREVTIQFNLCMEPWLKYSISAVADKGLKKPLFTSSRLKKGEVLYLETHSRRYELCFDGEKMIKAATAPQPENGRSNGDRTTNGDGESTIVNMFKWSRCKRPLPQKTMLSIGIPLPSEHVEVLNDNLEWDDIEWSQTGVWIAGKEYHLARAHFLSPN